jgi:hydroxymethylpyrimidine/phosphomethylpyrimidine kinase
MEADRPTVVKALTIAGSDSGGGAGIQADLKTFTMLGVYGMSVLTAVTAQNSRGVHGVHHVPLAMIAQQIDAVMTDLPPDAIKTGMLSQASIIELVADKLKKYGVTKLVVDPVMVAKGGHPLLDADATETLRRQIIPLATVVTPNIPEAETLTGREIRNIRDMERAAREIAAMGASAVVVKGGHGPGAPVDVLYDGQNVTAFPGERMDTLHTHGTGCTFAAAVTAELAKGRAVADAVAVAKEYVHWAIRDTLGIGSGHGPTNHWAYARRTGRAPWSD